MPEPTERLTASEIKARISFPQLMDYYGFRPERKKILCPFHYEKTASFHVYEDGGKCYGGCGWGGDVVKFVMDKESVYFGDALDLLCSWFGSSKATLPRKTTETKTAPKRSRPDPVNPEIINYFHNNLMEDKRVWLHGKRLITDQTIDYLKLGYRPDMDAYSIPFWEGVPGLSKVNVLQFRYCPREDRKARYLSLDNHGFAGLIGKYTINPDLLVMFVGTLDCVLANQDGIPAISPNGLTVWSNRLGELKWLIGTVKDFFLVPDNTISETVESVRLANALGAKIRYLPQMESGKDYTDWRLLGNTPQKFIEEVLHMSKTPFITGEHEQTAIDILDEMARGNVDKALELLEILELNEYAGWSVSHKLMCLASGYPGGMAIEHWKKFIHAFEYERTYQGMGEIISITAQDQMLRRGEF